MPFAGFVDFVAKGFCPNLPWLASDFVAFPSSRGTGQLRAVLRGLRHESVRADAMVRRYSQRLVNPFRGILSVVETEDADAVSSDGVHWALYIHGEHELARLSDGSERDVALPDIKYGDWSAQDGLKRAPVRNVVDHERLDAIGLHLLDAVKAGLDALPFPLRDIYELWLLDTQGYPLALLGVAVDEAACELPSPLMWRPGERAKAAFQPHDAGPEQRCAGERLQELVNAAAGPRPAAQWFRRERGGAGVGLDGVHIDHALHGRYLQRSAFPDLLLRAEWTERAQQGLVDAFLDWQAPWLLQLQDLAEPLRAQLEAAACHRVGEFAQCHRLYPVVLDEERLTTARVEARLRGATDIPEEPEEDEYAVDATLIPYYRE